VLAQFLFVLEDVMRTVSFSWSGTKKEEGGDEEIKKVDK